MTPRRPTRVPRWRVAASVVLAGAAVAGCDTVTACPAIAWSNTLVVALAEDWPPGTARAVRVECPGPCGGMGAEAGRDDEMSAQLGAGPASFQLMMTSPESVVVTVLDRAGAALTELEASPEWVRVGGTAECGGPAEATVTVPAP